MNSLTEEQELADAIVAAFVARCRHLWPGCVVTARHSKQIENSRLGANSAGASRQNRQAVKGCHDEQRT
jgi:hypothetical protein